MTTSVGSAPGRLDLLGGVADYSGALVLQVPTRVRTTVTAEPADALIVGDVDAAAERGARRSPRRPTTTCARRSRPRRSGRTTSSASRSSSSATACWNRRPVRLTVDVRRADRDGRVLQRGARGRHGSGARRRSARRPAPHLATLCQEAENRIVGAPCGIMDQVAVTLGVPGAVLPDPVPAGLGRCAGGLAARHRGRRMAERRRPRRQRAIPYGHARGRPRSWASGSPRTRTGRPWPWISELPQSCLAALPDDARRRRLPRPLGRDRRPLVDDRARMPPTRCGPRRPSASPSTSARRSPRAPAHGRRRRASARCSPPATRATARWDSATRPPMPSSPRRSAGPASTPPARAAAAAAGPSSSLCDRGALDDVPQLIR